MKMKKLFAVLLAVASVMAASCKKENGDNQFSLRYFGVTQIGPNLTVLLEPYYNAGVPVDFAISAVSVGTKAYSGPEFSIDSETGVITVSGNQNTAPGIYKLSVSCRESISSRVYNFADAVEVEFLKGVPDGIAVTPSEATVDVNSLALASEDELPQPIVTTDGDHVDISAYRIANVRNGETVLDNMTSPYFQISDEGVITIVKGAPFQVGVYSVDLKLSTACYGGDSEEGFYADAFTLNVVSAPRSVTYSPSSGVLEEETDEYKTKFTSAVPQMTGSQDEVQWSIANIAPACDKIAIDPQTGVISVEEGHNLPKGSSYLIDVRVKNRWSTDDGLVVPGAFSLEIVEFIYPIEGYSYPASSKKFATGWKIAPAPTTRYVRNYFWTEPEADYTRYLTLDAITGEVTATKGNSMPQGEYQVKVSASNGKQDPVVATLSLSIVENPYYFTYFAYGNNLGLSEEQTSGASQFRVASQSELGSLAVEVKYTDLSDLSKATWKASSKNQLSSTTIDAAGKIRFSTSGYKAAQCGVLFVTATTKDPDDADNGFSVTVPVFIDMPTKVGETTVSFTPFVLRVNPAKGGRSSAVADHPGVSSENFIIDYRRTFNYWNLEGVRSDGTPLESGVLNNNDGNAQYFLQHIWTAFGKASGMSSGYGSKNAISYFNGNDPKTPAQLAVTPAYVDNAEGPNKYSVVVNPGLWYDEGWADGVFLAQMTYVTNGDVSGLNKTDANQRFPLAIWFDKDFE